MQSENNGGSAILNIRREIDTTTKELINKFAEKRGKIVFVKNFVINNLNFAESHSRFNQVIDFVSTSPSNIFA